MGPAICVAIETAARLLDRRVCTMLNVSKSVEQILQACQSLYVMAARLDLQTLHKPVPWRKVDLLPLQCMSALA